MKLKSPKSTLLGSGSDYLGYGVLGVIIVFKEAESSCQEKSTKNQLSRPPPPTPFSFSYKHPLQPTCMYNITYVWGVHILLLLYTPHRHGVTPHQGTGEQTLARDLMQ